METHHLLSNILILLISGVIAVPIFHYLGLGAILGYLFAGIVIGPSLLGLINDVELILGVAELGVVFLLFIIGLELEPKRLWQMRLPVFGMGATQVLLTGAILTGLFLWLNFSLPVSFIIAFSLSLSSTAFALQLLQEKHQLQTLHGESTFSILLFQDLAVVPLIAAVNFLAPQKLHTSFSWEPFIELAVIVLGVILIGRFLIRPVFRWIAQSRIQEIFTATTLLIVVGTAILLEAAGLSMAMGAFLAGILLANSEYRHELEINLEPFKGILLGIFFIAVGMSLDLNIVFKHPVVIFLSVIGLVGIKILLTYGTTRLFRLPAETARNVAVSISQGGEFAFVIYTAAEANQLLSHELSSLLIAIVTLSMALTPILFKLNAKFLRTFSELSERPFDTNLPQNNKVIIAGFGRFGQVISRLLRTENIPYIVLELNPGQVDTAIKFGTKIYYGDASRRQVMHTAGAEKAKILVLAIDDPATSIHIARMTQKYFPHLQIIARARNRMHAMELLALGIETIHRETLLSSVAAAKDTLLAVGVNQSVIERKIKLFIEHDHRILKEQVQYRHDEEKLINHAHLARKQLDEVLMADREAASLQQ